jgi:hypothetical protein
MLNCGMTQKDIADLAIAEVDWDEGRIIRKRSKTGDCESVPTVNYKLWPETFRLLRQERAQDSSELVLLNSNGSPLWTEQISAAGKYQKTDNVKNAFDRLQHGLDALRRSFTERLTRWHQPLGQDGVGRHRQPWTRTAVNTGR